MSQATAKVLPFVSRRDALELLGDLLEPENKVKHTNLFDEPRKTYVKPEPRWIGQGLTVVYVQQTCVHCGHTHTHVSPLILMHEAYENADGKITKTRKTAHPESLANLKEDFKNIEIEYIQGSDVPFCGECIEELTTADWVKAFKIQQEVMNAKTLGSQMERNHAIEKAAKKLVARNKEQMVVKEDTISLDDLLNDEPVSSIETETESYDVPFDPQELDEDETD